MDNDSQKSYAKDWAGWPNWSPADVARRQRSIAELEARGVPYLAQLPIMLQSEARPRAADEIARRLLAMFGVCVYSEARNGGEGWDEAQKYLARIDMVLGGRLGDALTPKEKSFLAVETPGPGALATFGWRYECCHVLMWALGFVAELGYPSDICDVSAMAAIIWAQEDLAGFLSAPKPRSGEETLDMADLVFMYDWACVDARVNGRPSPAGLNGEVTVEWHYAANWLIGGNNNAAWDDISPDT